MLDELISEKIFSRVISEVSDAKKKELHEMLDEALNRGIIAHLDVLKLSLHLKIDFKVLQDVIIEWCDKNGLSRTIADPHEARKAHVMDRYDVAVLSFDEAYESGEKVNMTELARNIGVSRNTTYAYLKRWKKDRGL